MHARRRALSAGAVLAASASIVLGAAPAQAACGAESNAQWQVGAQLGPAPVELTGTGGPLAALLSVLPVSGVAVEDASGQNLLRLDAASVRTRTESPALPDESALPGDLGLAEPVGGVTVTEAGRARAAQAAAAQSAANRPAQPSSQVDSASAPRSTQVPLRAAGQGNELASPFNWVPIESFGLLGPDDGGLPWAAGLAVLVLGAGVASVTVVARRGRIEAG